MQGKNKGVPAQAVAPFVGAWIEIRETFLLHTIDEVAPFVGAWIEICIIV